MYLQFTSLLQNIAIIITAWSIPVLRIPVRVDTHYFGKLDPDPDCNLHQSKKLDPDPDPHHSQNRDPDLWRLTVKPWKVYKSVHSQNVPFQNVRIQYIR